MKYGKRNVALLLKLPKIGKMGFIKNRPQKYTTQQSITPLYSGKY